MKYKLQAKRVEKGIKQKDLAKQLGITQQYLCKLEKGKIEPRRNLMISISKILNTDVKKLFFED
ncbi:XRE family transcriptional regulator [Clostridium botulinum]|uniref:XRE family transcriptional regulator n=1 Tax=Clostridium botulinum TaxID=1491 RepID=A0ABC8CZG4_CLOBO|nr:helix-turn-helix transcriptional regulator [Clostridium botulinum]AVQ40503.1 XRE family transcriptional regulator [Clostridium botulinum]